MPLRAQDSGRCWAYGENLHRGHSRRVCCGCRRCSGCPREHGSRIHGHQHAGVRCARRSLTDPWLRPHLPRQPCLPPRTPTSLRSPPRGALCSARVLPSAPTHRVRTEVQARRLLRQALVLQRWLRHLRPHLLPQTLGFVQFFSLLATDLMEPRRGIGLIDPDFQAKLIETNVCPMCHNKSLLPGNREPRHQAFCTARLDAVDSTALLPLMPVEPVRYLRVSALGCREVGFIGKHGQNS
jgi:hypothetical protein